jgi:osmoprotectant transport system permease protein
VIGTKPFAEQYVLAALIGERLRERGLSATTREGLGSAVIFNALRAGEIDVYVDYSGTIWSNQMRRSDVRPRADVLSEMKDWFKRDGIVLPGELGFENAYALAMRRERAEKLGIRTLGDLARHAGALSIAGDYEFFGRPEWQSIRQAYGLAFREQRTMQPEFMYAAVANGEADVIAGYTSDGRIAQHNLTVLDDPKQVIPPYDAVLLVSPKRANDQALLAALAPLVDAINVATMREANLRASGGGASVAEAARWLSDQIQSKATR